MTNVSSLGPRHTDSMSEVPAGSSSRKGRFHPSFPRDQEKEQEKKRLWALRIRVLRMLRLQTIPVKPPSAKRRER
jgi:hypothetical protein